ncbi:unnamed protein product [Anisakis simplex]|uniref:SAM-dependent MTase TRM10-type domain-containing protein n=1 Tax=Anisakis simplex TaxID=6269 RepID=A0A158PN66_ANISI|nr:unnamed protein product [Anisakis simplex]
MNLNLPADVLPSREFVMRYKRNYERDKLARLLSEMEIIYELFSEVPRYLNDDEWTIYFNLRDIYERERFLSRLYLQHSNASKIQKQQSERDLIIKKISEECKVRFERGEMVYAPGYHTYFDIRGQYFRRLVDSMYGCRVLAAMQCGEMPPQLIIDCRFLDQFSDNYQIKFLRQIQKLHDANWFHRCPFPVSIVNLLADDHLARYIKKYWLFLYGPERIHQNANEYVNDNEKCHEEDGDDFTELYQELDSECSTLDGSKKFSKCDFSPHPFIPTISSRSIRDNLSKDISDDEVVYISNSAPRMLDGPISKYKAIVICSSYDLQPWSSSLSAARCDRLTPYRLPIERYVKWERGYKVMSINVTANIIRSVYLNDGDWKSAIIENVPEYHFSRNSVSFNRSNPSNSSSVDVERKNRLRVGFALQEAIEAMDRRRIDAFENDGQRNGILSSNAKLKAKPKIYHHKYSREERRARKNS